MVSKRNFFSITIMMFVLLFLFQFSMVIRDRQNTYDVNSNFTTRQKDGKNVWKNKQIDPVAVRTTDRSYALFVGDSSSDMATAVSRWCIYAKWDMAQCRNLEDYQENDKALPGMLILESEKYALGDNLEKLEKLEQKGVIIVFGCLENPKNIEKNQELMDFLGIYKVVSEKTRGPCIVSARSDRSQSSSVSYTRSPSRRMWIFRGNTNRYLSTLHRACLTLLSASSAFSALLKNPLT